MPMYSWDRYSRISKIKREELIREIEKLYSRDIDNQSERSKKAKPAILRDIDPSLIEGHDIVRDDINPDNRTVKFAGDDKDGLGLMENTLNFMSNAGQLKGVVTNRKITIPNIGEYVGESVSNRPQGRGRMVYQNNDIYEGDF